MPVNSRGYDVSFRCHGKKQNGERCHREATHQAGDTGLCNTHFQKVVDDKLRKK